MDGRPHFSFCQQPYRQPHQNSVLLVPLRNLVDFDPEAKRLIGVAFEMARVALRLADRGDLADEVIAKRIIELVLPARGQATALRLICIGLILFGIVGLKLVT
jgi:hypothetical protein